MKQNHCNNKLQQQLYWSGLFLSLSRDLTELPFFFWWWCELRKCCVITWSEVKGAGLWCHVRFLQTLATSETWGLSASEGWATETVGRGAAAFPRREKPYLQRCKERKLHALSWLESRARNLSCSSVSTSKWRLMWRSNNAAHHAQRFASVGGRDAKAQK